MNTGETKMFTDQQIHQIYVENCMKKERAFEKTFAEKFRKHMFDKYNREVNRFATHYNLRKNKNGTWNSHAMSGMLHGKKYPSDMQKYLSRLIKTAHRIESYEGYVRCMKRSYMNYSELLEIRGDHPWYMKELLENYQGKIGK
jgi:hypothetical protein